MVAAERDPKWRLIAREDDTTVETNGQALVGNYREEHVLLREANSGHPDPAKADRHAACEQLALHQMPASLARAPNDDHTLSPAFDVVVKGAGVKSDSSFLTFGS